MALQVTEAHGVPSGKEPAGGDGSPRAPSDAGGLVGNARGFTQEAFYQLHVGSSRS